MNKCETSSLTKRQRQTEVVYKQGTEDNVRQDIPDGTTLLYEVATNDMLDSVTL